MATLPVQWSMPCEHISAEDLAAYLEGRTGGIELARIESHLIHCQACLGDVLATLACLPRSAEEDGRSS